MIFRFREAAFFILFFFSIIILSSCNGFNKKGDGSLNTDIKTENIYSEIKKLDENKKDPDPEVRVRAHLQLAALYLSYKNPNPNYSMALKELEAYTSLNPEGVKREEIQNWLGVLREIEKIKHKTAQLSKENKELKDVMEKLKALDIKMEQKRKKIK